MAATRKDSARSFILSHPGKTAAEVVELGKAAGFTALTTGYVHSARSSAKKESPGKDAKKSTLSIAKRTLLARSKLAKKGVVEERPASPETEAAAQFGFGTPEETQLAALVWRLGPNKARVIVDHVERIKMALRA